MSIKDGTSIPRNTKEGLPTPRESGLYLQLVDSAYILTHPRKGTGSYDLAVRIKKVAARFTEKALRQDEERRGWLERLEQISRGCSDGNCKMHRKPITGQVTNGGCNCVYDMGRIHMLLDALAPTPEDRS